MSTIAKPPRRSLGTLIGGAAYGRAFRRIEPALDADAAKYLAAVEAADQQVLEDGIKRAVSKFVRACKADGNWDAIKASCILCGARTLAGALVPLKGAAPTNNNFAGLGTDYSRTSGLTGDGSTKYLDSNRANNADPQDDNHNALYISTANTSDPAVLMGSGGNTVVGKNRFTFAFGDFSFDSRSGNNLAEIIAASSPSGFVGHSRSSGASVTYRVSGSNGSASQASNAPNGSNVIVFARDGGSTPANATLAFYSIGEAVDLALLDTAVSTLVSEIGAAL